MKNLLLITDPAVVGESEETEAAYLAVGHKNKHLGGRYRPISSQSGLVCWKIMRSKLDGNQLTARAFRNDFA